jgi:hypothetical protein
MRIFYTRLLVARIIPPQQYMSANDRKHIGWDTEMLCSQVYLKIRELQKIVAIAPKNKKVRKSTRFGNIQKLIILLLWHIQS